MGHSGKLLHGFEIQTTALKLSNVNRAEPHGNPIILIVNRTPALQITVSKLRHQHTTTSMTQCIVLVHYCILQDCPLTAFLHSLLPQRNFNLSTLNVTLTLKLPPSHSIAIKVHCSPQKHFHKGPQECRKIRLNSL